MFLFSILQDIHLEFDMMHIERKQLVCYFCAKFCLLAPFVMIFCCPKSDFGYRRWNLQVRTWKLPYEESIIADWEKSGGEFGGLRSWSMQFPVPSLPCNWSLAKARVSPKLFWFLVAAHWGLVMFMSSAFCSGGYLQVVLLITINARKLRCSPRRWIELLFEPLLSLLPYWMNNFRVGTGYKNAHLKGGWL